MAAKKEAVQAYIDRVLAPKIQGDGGWVEFVSLEGDRLTQEFLGTLTCIFVASAPSA